MENVFTHTLWGDLCEIHLKRGQPVRVFSVCISWRFRGGVCCVGTWQLCGDLFKDSNVDFARLEGTYPAAV